MDKYSHNVHFITTCSNPQKIIDNIHDYLKLKDIPLRKVILQTGSANGEKYYNENADKKREYQREYYHRKRSVTP